MHSRSRVRRGSVDHTASKESSSPGSQEADTTTAMGNAQIPSLALSETEPRTVPGGNLTTAPNPITISSPMQRRHFLFAGLAASALAATGSAATSIATIAPGSTFNVKDYGATGNGVTDDTAAINAACSAAVGVGNATVYFPDGLYKTTAAISLAIVGTITVRGNGKMASIILCSMNAINAIYCNCSGGPNRLVNRVEVCDLGFRTAPSAAPTCAVYVDYGSTIISSSANVGGSFVHDLDIWNNASNSGGFVYGVIMRSAWNSQVNSIYGYGSSLTYASASSPGGGNGGGGSGALIRYISGVNFVIDRIIGDFWGQGIRIEPLTSTDAYTPQGIQISNFNLVEAVEGIHYYTTSTAGGPDGFALTNVQIDQGNVNLSSHVGLYLEGSGGGGTDVYVSNCLFLLNNGSACIKLNGINGSLFSNVSCAWNGNKPTYGLQVTGISNNNVFGETCHWDAQAIYFGPQAGSSVCRNTGGCAISNAGLGNMFGDTRQFPVVVVPTATTTYSFSVNCTSVGLAAAPYSARGNVITSLPNDYICTYDYNNAGNTATTVFFLLSRSGGGLLTAGAFRLAIEVPAQ